MGDRAECVATVGKKTSKGSAYLESTELSFRGDFDLSIAFKDVTSAEARRGKLTLRYQAGTARFELGSVAEKWALKIRYPKGRLDKLGVKPDSCVALVGLRDEGFLKELKARTAHVSTARPKKDSDIVFFGAQAEKELSKLKSLRSTIKKNGAIWVVWPKGKKALTENHVRAAGPKVGLVDVKVVSFSDTLSALKMVTPLSLR